MSDPEVTLPPIKLKWWQQAMVWCAANPAIVVPAATFLLGVVVGWAIF